LPVGSPLAFALLLREAEHDLLLLVYSLTILCQFFSPRKNCAPPSPLFDRSPSFRDSSVTSFPNGFPDCTPKALPAFNSDGVKERRLSFPLAPSRLFSRFLGPELTVERQPINLPTFGGRSEFNQYSAYALIARQVRSPEHEATSRVCPPVVPLCLSSRVPLIKTHP